MAKRTFAIGIERYSVKVSKIISTIENKNNRHSLALSAAPYLSDPQKFKTVTIVGVYAPYFFCDFENCKLVDVDDGEAELALDLQLFCKNIAFVVSSTIVKYHSSHSSTVMYMAHRHNDVSRFYRQQ